MYCRVCGKEILDEAVICVHCGCQVQPLKTQTQETAATSTPEVKNNTFALVGFVLSLVSLFISFFGMIALVGLILSIIGLIQIKSNKQTYKGSGLAIAGIIVSAGSILWSFFSIFILAAIFESTGGGAF